MTVNVDLANRWIEALESGEYLQATGALRVGDSMCCLGVLCEISKATKWRGVEGGKWLYFARQFDLPVQVLQLLGTSGRLDFREQGVSFKYSDLPKALASKIHEEGPGIPVYEEARRRAGIGVDGWGSLAVLNDHGVKFPTIAKVLRWWLKRAKE